VIGESSGSSGRTGRIRMGEIFRGQGDVNLHGVSPRVRLSRRS
jgi:hypothetical protein